MRNFVFIGEVCDNSSGKQETVEHVWEKIEGAKHSKMATLTKSEALHNSEDAQVVVRFDGCCHWTISPMNYQSVDEKQDCDHHSKIGYTSQHYSSGDFKDDPLAFVTTVKQLRETLERYKTDAAYSKSKCTVGVTQITPSIISSVEKDEVMSTTHISIIIKNANHFPKRWATFHTLCLPTRELVRFIMILGSMLRHRQPQASLYRKTTQCSCNSMAAAIGRFHQFTTK